MPARGSKQEIVVQSDRDLLAPNYLEIGKEEELDNEEKGARKMTRPLARCTNKPGAEFDPKLDLVMAE